MKKNMLKTSLSFTMGLLFSAMGGIHAQTIYSNGFEGLAAGNASDQDIKTAWSTRYAKGPDDGRVNIITGGHTGKAAKIKYPAFGNQSTPSGATWETDISHSGEELYMSYWVKFENGFEFVKGGKLPGLGGSTDFPYGTSGFSTRLMWREDGKLEFYLHGYKINNSNGAEPYRVFWDTAGYHASVTTGKWHHIEIRQKLNSPGKRDGVLQGWLDGQLVCDDSDNSGVRATGQSSTKINHLFFSTFFGGSSSPQIQWQPKKDVYALFDDFIVSTQPIGMSAQVGAATSSGSSSSSSPTSSQCLTLKTGLAQEIDITNSNCVQFDANLAGKTLAVWDSDTNSACDFRGNLISIDGSGVLNVPDNYETATNVTGTKLKIEPSNGCKFLKVRAQ